MKNLMLTPEYFIMHMRGELAEAWSANLPHLCYIVTLKAVIYGPLVRHNYLSGNTALTENTFFQFVYCGEIIVTLQISQNCVLFSPFKSHGM